MNVEGIIQVKYQHTNDANIAIQWLNSLDDVFAADFETAIKYTKEERERANELLNNPNTPKLERIKAQSISKATPLGHPAHCVITHCSVACSDTDAFVFIIDSQDMADAVLDFLVETDKTQIWHNYSYDGRFIKYFTGKQPKNIEDTQIFAKTLVNHVDVLKAKTRLKLLAAQWYGDWAIAPDSFTIEQQYDPNTLKYAAIDACATYKLWNYLNEFVQSA